MNKRVGTSRAKAGAQPNQSLIDGITVLQALAIVDRTGRVPRTGATRRSGDDAGQSSAQDTRLSGDRAPDERPQIQSGSGMTVLAAQSLFASGLLRRALPRARGLRRFGHTVAMGVLWRDNVSYLFHAPPNMPETDALGRIGLYPATRGGIGMALLAALDDLEVEETYAGNDIPGLRGPSGAARGAQRGSSERPCAALRERGARAAYGRDHDRRTGLRGDRLFRLDPDRAMPDMLEALHEAAVGSKQAAMCAGPKLESTARIRHSITGSPSSTDARYAPLERANIGASRSAPESSSWSPPSSAGPGARV